LTKFVDHGLYLELVVTVYLSPPLSMVRQVFPKRISPIESIVGPRIYRSPVVGARRADHHSWRRTGITGLAKLLEQTD
jgi:hypothetical protein